MRGRRTVVLGAGVALVLAAAIVVLISRGGETSGASFPAAAASRRISIGPTSQADLEAKSALALRVNLPSDFRGSVQGRVAAAAEKPWAATEQVAVRGSGTRAVRLRVLAATPGRLASCESRQLSISLRDLGGKVVARRTRMLAPVPPRCGRFFGPRSIWTSPIAADAPVDKLSSPLVAALAGEVRAEFARNYPPTINTTSFSSPVYTVPAHQRRVPVRLVGSRVAYGGELKATLARGRPAAAGGAGRRGERQAPRRVATGDRHHVGALGRGEHERDLDRAVGRQDDRRLAQRRASSSIRAASSPAPRPRACRSSAA